jgi:periplasmic protein TonB
MACSLRVPPAQFGTSPPAVPEPKQSAVVETGAQVRAPGTSEGELSGDPAQAQVDEPDGQAISSDELAKSDETTATWRPRSQFGLESYPKPIKVPLIECPATSQHGIEGTVVLRVQVTREGRVRAVEVVEGIGHGCDEVAVEALERSNFKPAIDTKGEPADFAVRYEYAFIVKVENSSQSGG